MSLTHLLRLIFMRFTAWYQEHGAGVDSNGTAGRSFYTSLGHLNETWQVGHAYTQSFGFIVSHQRDTHRTQPSWATYSEAFNGHCSPTRLSRSTRARRWATVRRSPVQRRRLALPRGTQVSGWPVTIPDYAFHDAAQQPLHRPARPLHGWLPRQFSTVPSVR